MRLIPGLIASSVGCVFTVAGRCADRLLAALIFVVLVSVVSSSSASDELLMLYLALSRPLTIFLTSRFLVALFRRSDSTSWSSSSMPRCRSCIIVLLRLVDEFGASLAAVSAATAIGNDGSADDCSDVVEQRIVRMISSVCESYWLLAAALASARVDRDLERPFGSSELGLVVLCTSTGTFAVAAMFSSFSTALWGCGISGREPRTNLKLDALDATSSSTSVATCWSNVGDTFIGSCLGLICTATETSVFSGVWADFDSTLRGFGVDAASAVANRRLMVDVDVSSLVAMGDCKDPAATSSIENKNIIENCRIVGDI